MIEQLVRGLKSDEKLILSIDFGGINIYLEGRINGELVKISSELHRCLLEQENVLCTEIDRLIRKLRYFQKREHNADK